MKLELIINSPMKFSDEQINEFSELLKVQAQVKNSSPATIKKCLNICMLYVNGKLIGIGAIKKAKKSSFESAGVNELFSQFHGELGYLYIDNREINNRGKGFGKLISKMLLKKYSEYNIFATTEYSSTNPMYRILLEFGFLPTGNPYKGKRTGKTISLLTLIRK